MAPEPHESFPTLDFSPGKHASHCYTLSPVESLDHLPSKWSGIKETQRWGTSGYVRKQAVR